MKSFRLGNIDWDSSSQFVREVFTSFEHIICRLRLRAVAKSAKPLCFGSTARATVKTDGNRGTRLSDNPVNDSRIEDQIDWELRRLP